MENNNDDKITYADIFFWQSNFQNPQRYLNQVLEFRNVGFSEWVSRSPGLLYHKSSAMLNKLAENQIEFKSGQWVHYTPTGKSQKVLGGIGTINLPPNEDGWYLGSISTTNNASTGIPVLISEEVMDHHSIKEGVHIEWCKGKWMLMTNQWSSRFRSTENLPKAYLRINNPDDIIVRKNTIVPTVFHPFSIMEYEQKNSKFYDFVYVTVDSTEQDYRFKLQHFFSEYKDYHGRNGKYLIEPFVSNPLIKENEVLYHSPEELRDSAHLDLMVKRIRYETFQGKTLEQIKIALDQNLDIDKLKRFSDWIKISPNAWYKGDAVVDETANFLMYCTDKGKTEELVDLLIKEYPEIL
ncbi:MAG: hypothetical protein IPM42_16855 [Saprospiraceae bacterium]|nr:hypothetical protein [Saprospiraceae bacterium]